MLIPTPTFKEITTEWDETVEWNNLDLFLESVYSVDFIFLCTMPLSIEADSLTTITDKLDQP